MKKVLVVDDNEDILMMMRYILERHGFLVETEITGSKVKHKVQKFEPGLILLDFNLPEKNGDEICKELKENEATKHIPIILISDARNIKERYSNCDFCDFIEKPFEVKKLIEKVNEYFSLPL